MSIGFDIQPYGAVPNERQMQWYRRGKVAFLHFSINTFTGKEWGDGTDDPRLFNPTQLDCRQWIENLKKAGFTAAILTAKHHDGFCLWPSKYTGYSVKSSPYKNGCGDVVREFTDACHEYGIGVGLYLSPWDRNFPEWGTEKYNEYYAKQLTELMTGYGEICECWWDGAGSEDAQYDWKNWVDIIHSYQPECVIFGSLGATPYVDVRWVGNESGCAGEPCFATIDKKSVELQITDEMNSGKPDGERFIPAECDVSIRPGWFYHEEQDSMVKTSGQLTEYWFLSAGRNAGILLNVPPDKRGRLHENDCRSLIEWENNLQKIFNNNLAKSASVIADNETANMLLEQDDNTVYYANSLLPEIAFSFTKPVKFSCFRIDEAIELGHRVRGFALDAFYDGEWHKLLERECIGFCHSEHFEAVTAERVRIRITKAVANPVLRFFGLFTIPDGIFDNTSELQKDSTDLAAQPGANITRDENAVYIDLGGIFPYNTVIFDSDGLDTYEIDAFNGTVYQQVYSGTGGYSNTICRFSDVNGSYRLRITFNSKDSKKNIIPQVYLIN